MVKKHLVPTVAADPGAPSDGELWFNSTDDKIKGKVTAGIVNLASVVKFISQIQMATPDSSRSTNNETFQYMKDDNFVVWDWVPGDWNGHSAVILHVGVNDAGVGKRIEVGLFYNPAAPIQIGSTALSSGGDVDEIIMTPDLLASMPITSETLFVGYRREVGAGSGTVDFIWGRLEIHF